MEADSDSAYGRRTAEQQQQLQRAEPPNPVVRQNDLTYFVEELRRLNGRIDSTEYELARLQNEVHSLRGSTSGAATAGQVQSLDARLDSLQRQIQAVDAARAQDKKDVYDDIVKKVTTIVSTSSGAAKAGGASAGASSTSRSGSGSSGSGGGKNVEKGIEHVVENGQSLSMIAKAYGVKLSTLMEANGIKEKEANTIRVGQKIFVPQP